MRIAALALLVAATLRAQDASPCNNTPAYTTCELVFELSEAAAARNPEPYKTVDLKAEFRSPRHRTLALPAYWDGGRRIVVRFTPTEAGDWDYRVTSNVADFDGKIGKFTAAASPSPGFIQPENVHHWVYSERDERGLIARTCGWAPLKCVSLRRTTRHFAPWPMRARRRSSTTCADSSAARVPMPHSETRTRRISHSSGGWTNAYATSTARASRPI